MQEPMKPIARSYWGTLVLVGVIALCASSRCPASAEDFIYWAKGTFLIPIKEQWELGFEQKFGFTDESRRLDHHTQDLGVVYTHADGWLKLSGAVKTAHAQTDDRDGWIHETRPHLNAAIFSKLFGLDMANRSRLAYRDIDDEDNLWRFRHKVRFTRPVALTPLEIKPYVADEIFYNFNADRFNGHRLQAGLFVPLHKKIRLELFYFWHIHKEDDNDWCDVNVIGSFFRFKF